jgi:hypothetical protein
MNPEELISAYLDGTLDETGSALLASWLKEAPENNQRFTAAVMFDQQVRRAVQAGASQSAAQSFVPAASSSAARRSAWTNWRPLTAAAAGLVLGLFSASLVFGYVVPSLKTRIELLSDSFESGVNPAVDGQQPFAPGHWGGDFTEVVGAQGQVKPAEGQRMLRFVRADYEGHHLPDSFSSDSFQLLDLRPYKKEFANGTAVVRLSALFNGELYNAKGPFACVLKLYALDAELVEERKAGTFTGSIRERMLANSSSTRVRLDADPQTWQKASNELRLPPGTDYLMIQVGMTNDSKVAGESRDAFAAHFVDRVQVVLAHVPEVALP